MEQPPKSHIRKGRGATLNLPGRFEKSTTHTVDDGWETDDAELENTLATSVLPEQARSIISRNNSPDIPFTQSINPYRGCEHGCVYCYARPSHAYMDLSPGLDFESKLFFKQDAAELLKKALTKRNYECSPIALGSNTDPYQPIEREHRVTRSILETLSACDHPVTIVTKGAALIRRDIELLADMARRHLVSVAISVTTLDSQLKRTLEPRAASPGARLKAMRMLSEAGIPVAAMVAPVIPFLTDHEAESILEQIAEHGATAAGYVMLRLPHEVLPLFRDWLEAHVPLKAEHVMSRIAALHKGRAYDSQFGVRQRGRGAFADIFEQRFTLARKRHGLIRDERASLDTSRFNPEALGGGQLGLF